jgi:hypothetical protein
MNATQSLKIGTRQVIAATSPSGEFLALFEGDGSAGYFYALKAQRKDRKILDLLCIYLLKQDAETSDQHNLQIVWSEDGLRVLLRIDGYPHAIFDFAGKQGHCRMNYPNVPRRSEDDWRSEDHAWTDEALRWFPV